MQLTKLESAIQLYSNDFLATLNTFLIQGGNMKDLEAHAKVTIKFKNQASQLGLNVKQAEALNNFTNVFTQLYGEQLATLVHELLESNTYVEPNLAVHAFELKSAFGDTQALRIVAIFNDILVQQKAMFIATSKYLFNNVNFTAPIFLASEPFKHNTSYDKGHMILEYIEFFDKKLASLAANLNADNFNFGHMVAIGIISGVLGAGAYGVLSSPEERYLLQMFISFVQKNADELFEDSSELSFEEIITQTNDTFGKNLATQIIDATSKAFARFKSLSSKIEDHSETISITTVKILPSDGSEQKMVLFSHKAAEQPIAKQSAEKAADTAEKKKLVPR